MEIRNKITDEYKNYSELIGRYNAQAGVLETNTTQSRLNSILTMSVPFYLVEGITAAIVGSCMGSSFPIPSTILPGLIISSSLISGIICEGILYNKADIDNKVKNISEAESDKEFELELAEKKLETIKISHRMVALNPNVNDEPHNLNNLSQEEMIKRYEELKVIISNKLHDLDTLATKEYLFDLHDTYTHPLKQYLGLPLFVALTLMAASAAPLLGGSQPVTLLSNLVIPLAVGGGCGIVYQVDKALRRSEVYNAINSSLGTDAITKKEIKKLKELAKTENKGLSIGGYPLGEIISIQREIQKLVEEAKYIENNVSYLSSNTSNEETVEPQNTYTETVYYTTDNQKEVGLHLKPKKTNH